MDQNNPVPTTSVSSGSVALRVIGLFFLVGTLIGANYVLANNLVDSRINSDTKGGEVALDQSLQDLARQNSLAVDEDGQITVDGQLKLSNSAVLNPSSEPSNPVTGQLYLSSTDRKIYYYDGSKFVALMTGETSSDIGATGTPGTGVSVQGSSGITLTSGSGILVNGYRISNSGVTRLAAGTGVQVSGMTGDITVSLPQAVGPGNSPTFAGLTITAPLGVASGGTGASSAAGARANLGAAVVGANNDITSMTGLTTALSVPQGGTGRTSFASGSILVGNNASGVDLITQSGPGLCLISQNSGAPQFQSCPGGSGTITAGSPQNSGRLAKFDTVVNQIVNSRIEETGSDITVYGNIIGANTSNSTTALVIQNTLSNAVLTADTQNMRVTVRDLVINGHLISGGTAPGAAPTAGAGSGSTCTVAGNDTAGTITITTGSSGVAAGNLCDISFNTAFTATPRVLISPDSTAAAGLDAATTGRSTSAFTITSSGLPANSTAYVFNYIVIQ